MPRFREMMQLKNYENYKKTSQAYLLFRNGSEPRTFAVSFFDYENLAISHFRVLQVDEKLGFIDDRGRILDHMHPCAFVDQVKTYGTLALSPEPRPLPIYGEAAGKVLNLLKLNI